MLPTIDFALLVPWHLLRDPGATIALARVGERQSGACFKNRYNRRVGWRYRRKGGMFGLRMPRMRVFKV